MDNPFSILHGKDVSSVEFVRDYIQIRFNGPCLNVYSPISTIVGGRTFRQGSVGWRDALCEQINGVVIGSVVRDSECIQLEFENGALISISLRDEDYTGPEAAIFDPGHSECTWTF